MFVCVCVCVCARDRNKPERMRVGIHNNNPIVFSSNYTIGLVLEISMSTTHYTHTHTRTQNRRKSRRTYVDKSVEPDDTTSYVHTAAVTSESAFESRPFVRFDAAIRQRSYVRESYVRVYVSLYIFIIDVFFLLVRYHVKP